MRLPPGVVYLASSFPQVVVPPTTVFLATYVIRSLYGVSLPVWLRTLIYLASWPFAIFLHIQLRDWRRAQAAAAAGAVMPPRPESKRIGGLDLLKTLLHAADNHILGYLNWQWFERYGTTVNFRVLFEDRYFTVEPEYIKRILATDFQNYEKGPSFFFQMKSLLGSGVFNSDGEMWKFHRGMTRPFFSRDRIAHFDIFERHADSVLKLIKERMRQGYPIDWQDLIARFTLDSASEFLFGQDVCSLAAPLPYPPNSPIAHSPEALSAANNPANVFAQEFLQAQIASSTRSRYTQAWPLFEFWEDKAAKHIKTVDEFIEPLCREALRGRAEGAGDAAATEKEKDDETLLEHMVKLTDDPQIIRDETLNILLAGRDTTALTLTMAVYRLALHPAILQRLRAEVRDKVGMQRPTYDDIKDMKYLRAFINEVLRLYPAVPFNVRFSVNSAVWPSMVPGEKPIYVPAGIRVLYSVYLMHRRKDLWGPDADKFDPDRFIDDRLHRYLTPNPFIFIPFNAGPRICLGQQFAYNEMSFMLIRMLQRVSSITLMQDANPKAALPSHFHDPSGVSDGSEQVFYKNHLTMYVQGGIWVKMEEEPLEKPE